MTAKIYSLFLRRNDSCSRLIRDLEIINRQYVIDVMIIGLYSQNPHTDNGLNCLDQEVILRELEIVSRVFSVSFYISRNNKLRPLQHYIVFSLSLVTT